MAGPGAAVHVLPRPPTTSLRCLRLLAAEPSTRLFALEASLECLALYGAFESVRLRVHVELKRQRAVVELDVRQCYFDLAVRQKAREFLTILAHHKCPRALRPCVRRVRATPFS